MPKRPSPGIQSRPRDEEAVEWVKLTREGGKEIADTLGVTGKVREGALKLVEMTIHQYQRAEVIQRNQESKKEIKAQLDAAAKAAEKLMKRMRELGEDARAELGPFGISRLSRVT